LCTIALWHIILHDENQALVYFCLRLHDCAVRLHDCAVPTYSVHTLKVIVYMYLTRGPQMHIVKYVVQSSLFFSFFQLLFPSPCHRKYFVWLLNRTQASWNTLVETYSKINVHRKISHVAQQALPVLTVMPPLIERRHVLCKQAIGSMAIIFVVSGKIFGT